MTLTTHVAIGAGIGVLVGEPVLGFTLGVVSHFLVDMIPHGDTVLVDRFYIHKERLVPVAYTATDIVLSVVLFAVLLAAKPAAVTDAAFIAAVFGSALPDLLVGLADLMKSNKMLRQYYRFHFYFHDYFSREYGDVALKYALAAQAVAIVLIIKFVTTLA